MTSMPSRSFQNAIAANKFYPPRINKNQSISRHAIIAEKLGDHAFSHQVIILEAQAGQGKTTLIQQFLEHSGAASVWYQTTGEDKDPVFLLNALYLAFYRTLKAFASPQLDAILADGRVGTVDLQGCINIFLNDIDAALDEPLFLVLDDLHLINDANTSIEVLDYLIDTAPPNLNFILASRHPLSLGARAIRKNPNLLYLDNDDLVLTLADVETLYNEIYSMHIGTEEAEKILGITNGWIMGIVLAATAGTSSLTPVKLPDLIARESRVFSKGPDGFILSFFQDEIFSRIPTGLHNAFMKLSFLDEIDIELAEKLIDIDSIEHHLKEMADQNFFVYPLDDTGAMYRFHHLYQEFLQIKGRQVLGEDVPAEIFRLAADHYLQHDLVEKAFRALRNAEDYEKMEQVLKEKGLKLVSANRTATILAVLETIDGKILRSYGWLPFFHAFLSTDVQPQDTLPHFQTSLERFTEKNDEAGELMALSQVIYFHFTISGRYHAGSQLLSRARTLFEQIHAHLPKEISIIVCRNLAAGYCFFDGRIDLARSYARRACELAERLGSKNFIAAARFILGYISLLAGDPKRARMEIERSYQLISNPLVGMGNRINLHLMQLCELSMHGNFAAFSHHSKLLMETVDHSVVRQTDAAPHLNVWCAIGLISMNRYDDALEVIEQGMIVSKSASSEHLLSQFLQWRGFIRALRGKREAALADIEQATAMRTSAGGPFFLGCHYAVKGAVLAIAGNYSEARQNLDRAMQYAEQIPSPYIKICALAYLSYVSIAEQDELSIELRLKEWLESMLATGYDYFWGWESRCMLTSLCEAVKRGIEPEFANRLAEHWASCSISPDGTAIPMMVIRTLGTFSISSAGTELFSIDDFSKNQRDVLGLLIASPDLCISQDEVQLRLWPESPPDKAGKAFYTLISRLRKVLKKALPVPKLYINVEKNYVRLTNTHIDAERFLENARAGLNLSRRELWWQAGNAFSDALVCWQKFVETDYLFIDDALDYSDHVTRTLRRMCLTWAKTLTRFNRIDEALALFEKVGRILHCDEELVTFQYGLYMKNRSPLKAKALLDNYRKELLAMDYTDEEAEQEQRVISRKALNPG